MTLDILLEIFMPKSLNYSKEEIFNPSKKIDNMKYGGIINYFYLNGLRDKKI